MKNSLWLVWLSVLTMLLAGSALADPMALPTLPDTSYTSETKESYAFTDDALLIYQQEIIKTKITHPVEIKFTCSISKEILDLVEKKLVHSRWLHILTNDPSDTVTVHDDQWKTVKLLPPWLAPNLQGDRLTHHITFDSTNQSFIYWTETSLISGQADSFGIFFFLACLGFWFFWLILMKSKEKKFHPFGWISVSYYLLALIFLNLITTFQNGFWWFTAIGIVGSAYLAWYSPLKNTDKGDNDPGALAMFFCHGAIFGLVHMNICRNSYLHELDFNYVHLNLWFISFIAFGKLSAWMFLLLHKALGRKKATELDA